MALSDVTVALQKFAQAMAPAPTRDELVADLAHLRAAPPPIPADTLGLGLRKPPACKCTECTHEFQREKEKLVTFAAWAGRVRALEAQLVQLTWGDAKTRDALGDALASLCGDILDALERTRGIAWSRTVTYDGRGRPTGAYETGPAIAERSRALVELYRAARERLPFFGSEELRKAIAEATAHMSAILATPLQRPLEPKIAHQAGTEPGRPDGDAERAGLWPNPASPNVLEGPVKFGRR